MTVRSAARLCEQLAEMQKIIDAEKYRNSIADAVADLGRPEDIGQVFAGFQKYLYQQQAVA